MKNIPTKIYKYELHGLEYLAGDDKPLKCRYGFVLNGFVHYIDYPYGGFWPYYKKYRAKENIFKDWKRTKETKDIKNILTSFKNIKDFIGMKFNQA